jgi:outer membrane protein assembly factor BamD
MNPMKHLIILCLLCSLSACTWWKKDEDKNPFEGVPANTLYTDSKSYIKKKEYSQAIKRLEALETLYPFNDYAEQAQLDLIYAYYEKGEYASAAATADRFIHLYPRSEKVDYAYYMKGLSNFQQNRGTLANALSIDESWRDPGTQTQAYADFAALIQQFPESRYRDNALQRMIYLRNLFAQRELNFSKYYYERNMFVAAAERANHSIKNYPQAPSAKEALTILARSNDALGLTKAAEDARRVYAATYQSPMP